MINVRLDVKRGTVGLSFEQSNEYACLFVEDLREFFENLEVERRSYETTTFKPFIAIAD